MIASKRFAFLALAALAAATAGQAAAKPDSTVRAGVLTCSVEGGASFVFGSTKDMRCVFENAGGKSERYVGRIDKFGVDIGVTGKSVLVWTVFAPTNDLFEGALSGDYVGVAANAAAGVGGGANLLVGGSNDTISLQPLSAQAQTGLNAALAIAALQLKAVDIRS
ncbi:MAG: DUF992 domain-containing protein [Hyphomicrobiales bacterium]|nr:DUF992 domain-containing protein [Hyphomicrobiales bacterium]